MAGPAFSESGSGFFWSISPVAIADNLDKWLDQFFLQINRELELVADRIVSWAKSNHPWTNRTGAAEAALGARVIRSPGGLQLILGYITGSSEGQEHGFWMEYRWNGIWGVVKVALESHYDDVMNAVRRALGMR